jgi:hypothetical protein
VQLKSMDRLTHDLGDSGDGCSAAKQQTRTRLKSPGPVK